MQESNVFIIINIVLYRLFEIQGLYSDFIFPSFICLCISFLFLVCINVLWNIFPPILTIQTNLAHN
jgi:hypothetical protein